MLSCTEEKHFTSILKNSSATDEQFKRLQIADGAQTAAHYIFKWNLEVVPVGSNTRTWQVVGVEDTASAYNMLW